MKKRRPQERTGFRLFKAVYRARDGTMQESPRWCCEFRDALEATRRLTLFTSKSASEQAARQVVRLVADVQACGKATDPGLVRWASGLPERLRKRLGAWRLLDADRMAVGRPLDELLDQWRAALRARNTTERQARQQRTRAKRLIEVCGFKRLTDVQRGRVETTLAKLRKGSIAGQRRIGQRTSNGYLQALGSFCRWAVAERMLGEDPLAQAERVTVTDEQERDALDPEEQGRLIGATQDGPVRLGMSGSARAMLYKVALGIGLRASELASLTRACFALDGDEPVVTLAPAMTKNRKGCTLPLEAGLAAELRAFVAMKTPDAKVFPTLPRIDALVDVFRADLSAARHAWLAESRSAEQRGERERSDFLKDVRHNGRVLTFHSLRHSFVANGKREGVPLVTMMQLARHSDPKLTAKRYGALTLHDLAGAAAKLRVPKPPTHEAQRATGTDQATAGAADDAACLASCLAESGRSQRTWLDSDGRIGENAGCSQVIVNTAERPENTAKKALCARSSAGQSNGFLNRRSQVRILPGASPETLRGCSGKHCGGRGWRAAPVSFVRVAGCGLGSSSPLASGTPAYRTAMSSLLQARHACRVVPGMAAHPRTCSGAGEPAYCGYVNVAGACLILTGTDTLSASHGVLGMSAVMKRRSRMRRVLEWMCTLAFAGSVVWIWLCGWHFSPYPKLNWSWRLALDQRYAFWLFASLPLAARTVLWYTRPRSVPRGHCQTCGYNLTGNVSGVCPGCGTPIKREGERA
jgi:integrase/recombinase XerC